MKLNHIPAYLRKGDEIRIVAPASKVEKDYIDRTIQQLGELGYKVSLGEHVMDRHHQFAGSDTDRIADMQNALDDPSVKAVFCARGGYGSVRLIDKLNFGQFQRKPKWLAGFSDITVFHVHLNIHLGIPSLHAPMPVNIDNQFYQSNLDTLAAHLAGNHKPLRCAVHSLNRPGSSSGKLVGGNLSIIYNLQSTPFSLETRGRILFLEEVGEQLYHLDRMMNNLRLSGKLSEIKGLILGGFTAMKDKRPFGKKAYEIIRDYTEAFDYPVVFGFPAGHLDNNIPLVLGAEIELIAGDDEVQINYQL